MTYKKNRDALIQKQLDVHGYNFCQYCYTSNSFMFSVHHIVFRSEMPNHKEIHNRKNLIIVCQKCHDDFHNNKSIREPLLEKRGLKKLFDLL